jgi:vacuolar protein sorting-associated protein 13A/C
LEEARLCLNALQLEHAFGGRRQVFDLVIRHYRLAFFRQLGSVVGSFAFLGDPVGLLNNISTGVKDLFYEPLEVCAHSTHT